VPTPNKFTNVVARKIRELHFYDGWGIRELARRYKARELTIRRVLEGETYEGAGGPSNRFGEAPKEVKRPKSRHKRESRHGLNTALTKCKKRSWSEAKIDQFKAPRWVVDAHLVPTFDGKPHDE
jgi:transposase